MNSIFDHHALLYMLEQFPRHLAKDSWSAFERACINGQIISQREAQKSMESEAKQANSHLWIDSNKFLFKPLNQKEAVEIGKMIGSGDFEFYDNSKLAERRMPESIPFILAIARVQNRCYVYRKCTNEDYFKRIITICQKYNIVYMEIEDYLTTL